MKFEDVSNLILGVFRNKESFEGLGLDDDYYDSGISSLTIVEMQIMVEEALRVRASTVRLMACNTIRDWMGVYSEIMGIEG